MNECPFLAAAEFGDLRRCQALLPAKVDALFLGFPNPIHLALSPDLCLKLCYRPQHAKQQAASSIAGVDMLVEDVEVNLLAGQLALPPTLTIEEPEREATALEQR